MPIKASSKGKENEALVNINISNKHKIINAEAKIYTVIIINKAINSQVATR
jgi:hypothetical protein